MLPIVREYNVFFPKDLFHSKMRLLVTALFLLFLPISAAAQDTFAEWSSIGVPLVEDFNSYLATGFDGVAPAGGVTTESWSFNGLSDGDCDFYDTCLGLSFPDFTRGTSTGGESTGGLYAFDVDGAGNVVFGLQPIGNDATPGELIYQVFNVAGASVTDVDLSYDVWVYNDQGRSNSVKISWSGDNFFTSTDLTTLDLTSPAAAAGSPAWTKTSKSVSIDLGFSLQEEGLFSLKFTFDDVGGSGSRDEFGIDNVSTTPFSSLAAELTEFSVLSTESGLLLEWATTSEDNLNGFEIEQATGSGAFEAIGYVDAKGPGTYRYATKGDSRRDAFRLKMVDSDGTFSYSKAIETELALTESFELEAAYPNPFVSATSFNLTVRDAQDVTVELYDALGRRVQSLYNGRMADGESRAIQVDGAGLAVGTYLYRVTGSKFVTSGRLVLGR